MEACRDPTGDRGKQVTWTCGNTQILEILLKRRYWKLPAQPLSQEQKEFQNPQGQPDSLKYCLTEFHPWWEAAPKIDWDPGDPRSTPAPTTGHLPDVLKQLKPSTAPFILVDFTSISLVQEVFLSFYTSLWTGS